MTERSEGMTGLRVVVAHNRYASGQPSGENVVVDAEIAQLRAAGVTVLPFQRSSDEISTLPAAQKALLPLSPIWNRWSARDLAAIIAAERPHVVHLHNPYPLISPWVVRVAQRAGIPVVQTVHNYRQVCAPGLYFRDGRICTDCKGRAIGWPAVRHACYRGSRPQSAIMAATLAIHRGTWRGVDRYIALTEAVAAHLRDFGVPADRIRVKPNGIPDPGPVEAAGSGFLFASRLVPEKGVGLLLDAWRAAPAGRLRIAGDGPLRGAVEEFAAERDDVEYLGPLPHDRMRAAIAGSAAVIVASTWHDVLPTIAVEALAAGRGVLGTAVGGIPWIVGDAGWVVEPTAAGLADGLAAAAAEVADPAAATALGGRARRRYEAAFTPDATIRALIGVYTELVETSGSGASATGARTATE
jgi:glycosyltransferase involved in cell wall biosynthesis